MRHWVLVNASVIAFVAQSGTAIAQQDPEADVGTGSTAPGEIIVTAQKRSESINKVGLTVSAATGEQLALRGITDTSGLEKIVPGFTYTRSPYATPVFTLRGIGLYDYSLASSPSVAVYMDQVPLPYPTMTDTVALDIQRVEVLKGPQGTLFGQSSTGGAINYIANMPTSHFEAGVEAGVDNFGKLEANGFLSGPLTEGLNGRLALSGAHGGDWQRNTADRTQKLGDDRKFAVRGTLDWEANDRLRFVATGTFSSDRSDVQAPQFTYASLNTYGTPEQAAAVEAPPISQNPFAVVDPALFDSYTNPESARFDPTFITRQTVVFDRAASGREGTLTYLGTENPGSDARDATWTPGFPQRKNDKLYIASLRADYNVADDVTVTSLSSYSRKNIDQSFDNDATAAPQLDTLLFGHQEFISQELRVALDTDRFHGLVGASYDHSNVEDNLLFDLTESGFNSPLPGQEFSTAVQNMRQKIDNYSLFANAELEIADGLKVQGGIRYNWSNRSADLCTFDPPSDEGQNYAKTFGNADIVPDFGFYDLQTAFGLDPAGHVVVGPGECGTFNTSVPTSDPAYLRPIIEPFEVKLRETNVPWRAGLSYQLQQGTLLYATISKGYKSGIIGNFAAAITSQYRAAPQEKLLAYEAGFKAPLLGRRVQLNGATFYYDYTDKQVRGRVQDPIFGLVETTTNIPKSSVFGIEGELAANPVRGLTLSLSGTYLKAKITESFSSFDGQAVYNQTGYTGDFDGARLPYTPRYSAAASIDYQFGLSDTLNGFIGGGITYRGETNATFENEILRADEFRLPDYVLLDSHLGLASADGRWTATLYCNNCTNTYYVQSRFLTNDTAFRFAGRPATVGVKLNWKID
ncbi:TonB-dependent receptor [Croceicoccus bisphenolivorans]|uniref:TonB-dependent receptor n=1 Tax=Croceicoccus bisphenolivorans TaxID=1783232 RepID=UPI000829E192|nr:TonB-dependent receptor [Croceicoccus bisphenolivorans]